MSRDDPLGRPTAAERRFPYPARTCAEWMAERRRFAAIDLRNAPSLMEQRAARWSRS